MIPSSAIFDQSTLARMLAYDPVVQDYQAFFALLEWSLVEQWQAQHSTSGRPPHPERAYLQAFLIRIREGCATTTQLRRFLVKHPLLIIELGFHLHLDPNQPYGFDVGRTLPCDSWLRQKLRESRSRFAASALAGHGARPASRDSRPGGSRRLRREAHLCVGAREQSACLCQRLLRCHPHSCWRPRLSAARQKEYQPG